MNCEKCGFEADFDAQFCPQCGEKTLKNEEHADRGKRILKKVLTVAICLVLVVVLFFFCTFLDDWSHHYKNYQSFGGYLGDIFAALGGKFYMNEEKNQSSRWITIRVEEGDVDLINSAQTALEEGKALYNYRVEITPNKTIITFHDVEIRLKVNLVYYISDEKGTREKIEDSKTITISLDQFGSGEYSGSFKAKEFTNDYYIYCEIVDMAGYVKKK